MVSVISTAWAAGPRYPLSLNLFLCLTLEMRWVSSGARFGVGTVPLALALRRVLGADREFQRGPCVPWVVPTANADAVPSLGLRSLAHRAPPLTSTLGG